MSWLHRLLHRCPTPERMPVTEDQRYWTCPDCHRVWAWGEINVDDDALTGTGIGWVLQ